MRQTDATMWRKELSFNDHTTDGAVKAPEFCAGVARFRPLALPLASPGVDGSPADWAHYNDEIWRMQITCRLLPDMR